MYYLLKAALTNVNAPIPSIDLEMTQHTLEEGQKMNYTERSFDNSAEIVSNSNKDKPKMYEIC